MCKSTKYTCGHEVHVECALPKAPASNLLVRGNNSTPTSARKGAPRLATIDEHPTSVFLLGLRGIGPRMCEDSRPTPRLVEVVCYPCLLAAVGEQIQLEKGQVADQKAKLDSYGPGGYSGRGGSTDENMYGAWGNDKRGSGVVNSTQQMHPAGVAGGSGSGGRNEPIGVIGQGRPRIEPHPRFGGYNNVQSGGQFQGYGNNSGQQGHFNGYNNGPQGSFGGHSNGQQAQFGGYNSTPPGGQYDGYNMGSGGRHGFGGYRQN